MSNSSLEAALFEILLPVSTSLSRALLLQVLFDSLTSIKCRFTRRNIVVSCVQTQLDKHSSSLKVAILNCPRPVASNSFTNSSIGIAELENDGVVVQFHFNLI